METDVQIEFSNKESAAAFFKWFKREGFDLFAESKESKKVNQDFCLSGDTPAGKYSDMFNLQVESTR